MISYFKTAFAKTTSGYIISLVGIVLLSIAILVMLPDQTAGLGVAYALMILFLFILILVIDRIAVRFFPLKSISIIESILFIFIFSWVIWPSESVDVIVETENNHFVVVFTNGGKNISDFEPVFPAKKKLTFVNNECIFLDPKLEHEYELVMPKNWTGYFQKSGRTFYNGNLCNIEIYWNVSKVVEIDDLITCVDVI